MSDIAQQEHPAKKRSFYAHAIVGKNNQPLGDTSLAGMDKKCLGKLAAILNEDRLRAEDDNSPYRVVSLFFED
jgi:hypothetical protein